MIIERDNGGVDNISKASTAVVSDDSGSQSAGKSDVNNIGVTKVASKKAFLGGYRNKITGNVYYHASTQTNQSPWISEAVRKFHRDSQTVQTKNKTQQTPRNTSTQIQVSNIFITSKSDYVIKPSGKYVSADEIQCEQLKKVVILQKFVRCWIARKELFKRRESYASKLAWEEEQKRIRKNQDLEWLKELKERRLHPTNEDDFLLLFSDLQNWWNSEADDIVTDSPTVDKKYEMQKLVNSEADKIKEIVKLKSTVEKEKNLQKKLHTLNEASKPKLWKAYKSELPVITENVHKGAEIYNLYTTLSMKYISSQERIDVLKSLVKFISQSQKSNSELVKTLIQLAQREIDLHFRGTKMQNLEGLQSRIHDLFWQYAKQPSYNPEMKKLTKKSEDTIFVSCSSCKQYFATSNIMDKGINARKFAKCKKCIYIEKEGWIRKDAELYKRMLKLLIAEEEKKPTLSSIIYILQPTDLKYLVEIIWKRQSCLSGCTDEKDLQLVRYRIHENWTPWNCMVVTREEASILSRISDSKSNFDKDFKKFVYQKHMAARTYFSTIPRFLHFVKTSKLQNNCSDEEES